MGLHSYVAELHCFGDYESGLEWLDRKHPVIDAELFVLEYIRDVRGLSGRVCELMRSRATTTSRLIAFGNEPEAPNGFEYLANITFHATDLRVWLKLDQLDYYINVGKLRWQPTKHELSFTDQTYTVKVPGYRQGGVLSYLLQNAVGESNARSSAEILRAVWMAGNEATDVTPQNKDVQDIVHALRGAIEPDPKNPRYIKTRGRRGRGSGYYVESPGKQ